MTFGFLEMGVIRAEFGIWEGGFGKGIWQGDSDTDLGIRDLGFGIWDLGAG